MSSQRGNVFKKGAQKHQNSAVFRNNKYDKSKRTEQINNVEVAEVCKRCQDVIAWKIKYKKYKLLSQAKTCTKCLQRKIKDAYHTICVDCAKDLKICCKCGKKGEIVLHKSPTERERHQAMSQLDADVKALSERKRRAYHRYMDKLSGKKKKKKPLFETSEVLTSNGPGEEDQVEATHTPVSLEEYFRSARAKLEELKSKMDDDMLDDFDDLDICGSSDEESCEGDSDDVGDDNDSESDGERTVKN